MAQKDVIIRLRVEGAGNTQNLLNETTKEIDRLEKELKQAEVGTDRFLQAQRRLAQFQSTLKQRGSEFSAQLQRSNRLQNEASQRARQTTRNVNGLSGAFNLATKAGAAFIALGLVNEISQLGKSAVTAAGEYENLTIAFTTFLGGADKAAQVLAELNRFSVETPFTPEQVNLASRALIGQGVTIEDTIRLLKDLGNISAGVGTNFNELVDIVVRARAQNRLFQEDINQFTGRGIPILGELAKVLGKSEGELRKLVESGAVTYDVLIQAIQNLTSEQGKFGGLIEKQSKTLPGLLSTLEGAWNNLLRTIGEGQLLDAAKAGVNSLIGTIKGIQNAIDPEAEQVQASVSELKRELSLAGLTRLTKKELEQRQEQLNQSLLEEKQTLQSFLNTQRFASEQNSKFRADVWSQESQDRKADLKEAEAAADLDVRIAKARVAAIQIALDDISKIEDKARKDRQSKRAAELPDLLKLQIFRLELENEFLRTQAKNETKRLESNALTVNAIAENEQKLFELKEKLANLSAKNDLQRTLNAEKNANDAAKAEDSRQQAQSDNLEAIGKELQKAAKEALKLGVEVQAAQDGIIETSKVAAGGVSDLALKVANTIDTIFDGVVFALEDVLPVGLDLIGRLASAQSDFLDTSISIQETRIREASLLAEKGNAEILKSERERMNTLLDERARAARAQEAIAKAQTKVEIGLAAARAATQTFGLGPAGALAAGAAVAIGLPAIINSIPIFEKGGEVGGNLHSGGGTIIEAERGEFVVNRQSAKAYGTAINAINQKKASPELVNAAATGNLNQVFEMQTKGITDRLGKVEKAIKSIPQTAFFMDESGFSSRVFKIGAKKGAARE